MCVLTAIDRCVGGGGRALPTLSTLLKCFQFLFLFDCCRTATATKLLYSTVTCLIFQAVICTAAVYLYFYLSFALSFPSPFNRYFSLYFFFTFCIAVLNSFEERGQCALFSAFQQSNPLVSAFSFSSSLVLNFVFIQKNY